MVRKGLKSDIEQREVEKSSMNDKVESARVINEKAIGMSENVIDREKDS